MNISKRARSVSKRRRLCVEKLSERRLLMVDLVNQLCLPLETVLDQHETAEIAPGHEQTHDYHDDGNLRYTPEGLAYFHDPLPDDLVFEDALEEVLSSKGDGKEDARGGGGGGDGSYSTLMVPAFSSLPSSNRKIFLDFDGHEVRNTFWNNQDYGTGYNTGSVIDAPAWSMDGDLNNFSAAENERIREIWARVAEDFAPFNVDVTTVDPGVSTFTSGGNGIRVLISTDIDATTGQRWFPSAGGVAYLNSWNWTSDTPVWVFANRLGNSEKNISEAASHEVGHALNLSHDGRTSPAEGYYYGHGSGAEAWAPIMGVGYNRSLVQWSKGEYANANNVQDDLAIISARVPYRSDDHGNTFTTATTLAPSATGAVSASGLIERTTDLDVFSFVTQTGNVSLNFAAFETADGKGNLNIGLTLYDAAGDIVQTVTPEDSLNASVNTSLAKGFYSVLVDGVGRTSSGAHPGFTDYGSLGRYSLIGNVVPNAAPVAVNDSFDVGSDWATMIDVLSNDTDADDDELAIWSVSTPDNGSVAIVDGMLRYTPNAGFTGTDQFSYTAFDGLDGYAIGQVEVAVVLPSVVSAIRLNDDSEQRSRVTSLTVEFDSEVQIDDDAFELVRRSDNVAVGVNVATQVVDGATVATLTFTGSLMTQGGSLVDGNYLLTLRSNLILDAFGRSLDGDGDGVAAGDLAFGDDAADEFYRLYGDATGDRAVGINDFSAFRSAFGSRSGDSNFVPAFDVDNGLDINLTDFSAFRQRFGSNMNFS